MWGSEWFQVGWGQSQEWAETSIAAKELLPIVVAMAVWGLVWTGSTVVCHCDNQAEVKRPRQIWIMSSQASGITPSQLLVSLCTANHLICVPTCMPTSYYPAGSPHLSDHRLFGMFHSCTPQHNKDVILESLMVW